MRVICGFRAMHAGSLCAEAHATRTFHLPRRIKKKLALFNIAGYMNSSFGDTVAVRRRVNR